MVGILSDIGNVRKLNEDYVGYFEDDEKRLYVIADGMGGHNAGEVASEIAVNSTIEYIKNIESLFDIETAIKSAILFANKKIYELSRKREALAGMGTTITACLIKNKKMVVANVGDSNCHIITENAIHKVTRDHSLVQELVDSGSITEEEALKHPNKNIITRALGTSEKVKVDTYIKNITGIKKIILCTDGLTNLVKSKEIYDIINSNDNETSCKKLVELSKERGSRDNISVILFEGECKHDRNLAR